VTTALQVANIDMTEESADVCAVDQGVPVRRGLFGTPATTAARASAAAATPAHLVLGNALAVRVTELMRALLDVDTVVVGGSLAFVPKRESFLLPVGCGPADVFVNGASGSMLPTTPFGGAVTADVVQNIAELASRNLGRLLTAAQAAVLKVGAAAGTGDPQAVMQAAASMARQERAYIQSLEAGVLGDSKAVLRARFFELVRNVDSAASGAGAGSAASDTRRELSALLRSPVVHAVDDADAGFVSVLRKLAELAETDAAAGAQAAVNRSIASKLMSSLTRSGGATGTEAAAQEVSKAKQRMVAILGSKVKEDEWTSALQAMRVSLTAAVPSTIVATLSSITQDLGACKDAEALALAVALDAYASTLTTAEPLECTASGDTGPLLAVVGKVQKRTPIAAVNPLDTGVVDFRMRDKDPGGALGVVDGGAYSVLLLDSLLTKGAVAGKFNASCGEVNAIVGILPGNSATAAFLYPHLVGQFACGEFTVAVAGLRALWSLLAGVAMLNTTRFDFAKLMALGWASMAARVNVKPLLADGNKQDSVAARCGLLVAFELLEAACADPHAYVGPQIASKHWWYALLFARRVVLDALPESAALDRFRGLDTLKLFTALDVAAVASAASVFVRMSGDGPTGGVSSVPGAAYNSLHLRIGWPANLAVPYVAPTRLVSTAAATTATTATTATCVPCASGMTGTETGTASTAVVPETVVCAWSFQEFLKRQPAVNLVGSSVPPAYADALGPLEEGMLTSYGVDLTLPWTRAVFWQVVSNLGKLGAGAFATQQDPSRLWALWADKVTAEAALLAQAMVLRTQQLCAQAFAQAALENVVAVAWGHTEGQDSVRLQYDKYSRDNHLKVASGLPKTRCAVPFHPVFGGGSWMVMVHDLFGPTAVDDVYPGFDLQLRAWFVRDGKDLPALVAAAVGRWGASVVCRVHQWFFAYRAVQVARRGDHALRGPFTDTAEFDAALGCQALALCQTLGETDVDALHRCADWGPEDAAQVAAAYPDGVRQWSPKMAMAAAAIWACSSEEVAPLLFIRRSLAMHCWFTTPRRRYLERCEAVFREQGVESNPDEIGARFDTLAADWHTRFLVVH
jgi:hypothetical protein